MDCAQKESFIPAGAGTPPTAVLVPAPLEVPERPKTPGDLISNRLKASNSIPGKQIKKKHIKHELCVVLNCFAQTFESAVPFASALLHHRAQKILHVDILRTDHLPHPGRVAFLIVGR